MLKIVICDDDENDLQAMKMRVDEFWNTRRLIPVEVETSQSADWLIAKLRQGQRFHIYILDILMEEQDGIRVGQEIRQLDKDAIVIYATSSKEFALGAFGVFASGYLLKPVDQPLFDQCMDRVLGQIIYKKDLTLTIKTKDGMAAIDTAKLMWVENVSRVLYCHMVDGVIVVSVYIRQAFEMQLKELLEDFRFIQTHKSFVVNMKYVEKMMQREFVMMDKTAIPISRNNQSVVKKQYLEYLSKVEQ